MLVKLLLLGALVALAILVLMAYTIRTTPRLPYVKPVDKDDVGPYRRDPESSRDTEVS